MKKEKKDEPLYVGYIYLRPRKFFRNQILLDYLGRWCNQSCQIFFQSVHSGVFGKGSNFAIFSVNPGWPYNCDLIIPGYLMETRDPVNSSDIWNDLIIHSCRSLQPVNGQLQRNDQRLGRQYHSDLWEMASDRWHGVVHLQQLLSIALIR